MYDKMTIEASLLTKNFPRLTKKYTKPSKRFCIPKITTKFAYKTYWTNQALRVARFTPIIGPKKTCYTRYVSLYLSTFFRILSKKKKATTFQSRRYLNTSTLSPISSIICTTKSNSWRQSFYPKARTSFPNICESPFVRLP